MRSRAPSGNGSSSGGKDGAAAVEPVGHVTDDREHVGFRRSKKLEDLEAELAVPIHNRAFLVRERRRLEEHAVGDADLADIVQQGRHFDGVPLVFRQFQRQRPRRAAQRHADAVGSRRRVSHRSAVNKLLANPSRTCASRFSRSTSAFRSGGSTESAVAASVGLQRHRRAAKAVHLRFDHRGSSGVRRGDGQIRGRWSRAAGTANSPGGSMPGELNHRTTFQCSRATRKRTCDQRHPANAGRTVSASGERRKVIFAKVIPRLRNRP